MPLKCIDPPLKRNFLVYGNIEFLERRRELFLHSCNNEPPPPFRSFFKLLKCIPHSSIRAWPIIVDKAKPLWGLQWRGGKDKADGGAE